MIVIDEYIFFAARRSGHHAIIDALREVLPYPTLFINDGSPDTHPLDKLNIKTTHLDYRGKIPPNLQTKIAIISNYIPIPLIIIHNYEDFDKYKYNRIHNFKKKPIETVVLRDPFNLIASRLKWHRDFLGAFEKLTQKNLEKRLIDAFYIQANLLHLAKQETLAIIKFDDWLRSEDSDLNAAHALKLTKPLKRPATISQFGPGSSFDGMYNLNANQLQTSKRWENYTDDPVYRKVLLKPEVLDWTECHFSNSPGLEWARRQALE